MAISIIMQKSFEYRQCVVLAGMKLVDLHKAQTNVRRSTQKNGSVCWQGLTNQAGKLDTKNKKSHMWLLQHGETWLAHTHQPALVVDRSFLEYLVPL